MTEKTIILPPNPSGNGGDAQYRLTMMTPKRRYLSYLRERWWVLLVCLSLALGGIMAYETLRPATYISYAQIYTSGEVQLSSLDIFNEELLTYYGTQIELLKSARLQKAALERIGYTPKPDEKAPFTLDVSQPMKTSVFLLRATGSDPALTQRFLQALIDEYLAYKKDTRLSTAQDIVTSLTAQLAVKEKELKAAQEKWTEFESSNNVAALEEEGKSAGLYLSDLNLQIAKLKLDCDLLAQGLAPAASGGIAGVPAASGSATNAGSLIATNASSLTISLPEIDGAAQPVSNDALLQSAKVELAVMRSQRDQVLAEHGEAAAHRMNDAVTNLEQRVAILQKQNLEDNKTLLDQLEKRMTAMKASLPAWEEKVLKLDTRLAESERLKNDMQREQVFYDHLLNTLQNVDLSRNVQQELLSVFQPATPAAPVKRHAVILAIAALAFGLAAGLGLVFCWYLLDNRFVSVRDVKDQFGETVLGLVPQIKVSRSKPEQALLQANDPRPAYLESFRHLRSALLLSAGGEKRPQTWLFTGAAPAEGKTTVAVNLARVLAGSGLRVVLVDADPHNGRMHKLLGVPSELGVLDFLRGEAGAKTIVQPTDLPGLEFVPIGTRTEQSDGLFLRPNLKNLLEEMKTGRDFLILDGPPILAADDASLLVPHADGVIMVMRPFFSSSHQVRQALDMLYQRQARQVAIVFNQASKDDLAGHYAQYGLKPTARNGAAAKKA